MATYWISRLRGMRIDVLLIGLGALAILGAVTACDMHAPSAMTPNRLRLVEGEYSTRAPIEAVNGEFLEVEAGKYDQQGRGPFELTVTYDPRSRTKTAARARSEASRIAADLSKRKVKDIDVMVLPVNGQGDALYVMMDYDSYEAKPPEDCDRLMAGMEDRNVDATPDYKVGCSLDTILARQVARPRDFAGIVDESPTSDGRRASKIIEIYRAGSKDQKLQGYESTK